MILLERTAISILIAGTLALLAIAPAGCGSDSQADDSGPPSISPAYTKVVTGLREAAVSDGRYHANRRAKRLAKPEQAVVEAFCTFSWQIPVNHLVHLLRQHAYVVGRITHLAELGYRGPSAGYDIEDASIKTLVGRLERIVDLRSLDGRLIRRYSSACYR